MTTKATRRKRPHHVWVVEMWTSKDKWEPCSVCDPLERAAVNEADDFRTRNPYDKFRVARYERVEK